MLEEQRPGVMIEQSGSGESVGVQRGKGGREMSGKWGGNQNEMCI